MVFCVISIFAVILRRVEIAFCFTFIVFKCNATVSVLPHGTMDLSAVYEYDVSSSLDF